MAAKKVQHLSKVLSQLDLANSGNEHIYASDDLKLGGKPVFDGRFIRTPQQSEHLDQLTLGRGDH